MRHSTLTVQGAPILRVEGVGGDLQIVGWERSEVTAKADGDTLQLESDGQVARASSGTDLILYVPRDIVIRVEGVGGDADIRAVPGGMDIASIGGDLQMRNVGVVKVGAVGGDMSVRGCAGDFSADSVGGDASLHEVKGSVSLSIGADLYLRNAEGSISAQAGADAVLYLVPQPGQSISVQAGSDILVRVPAKVDATFSLQGCDDESIRVDLPGVDPVEVGMFRQMTLGTGSASINLTAGSEIIVTSRQEEWESVAEFDPLGREAPFAPGEFPGITPDMHERISRRMEEATRRALKASVRAQEQSERVQRRVDSAMRRAEEKMRSAERRTAHMGISIGKWGVVIDGNRPKPPTPPVPPFPPRPVSDPVSDEERLTILKMLQEKKISLQEAEKLLAALEGK